MQHFNHNLVQLHESNILANASPRAISPAEIEPLNLFISNQPALRDKCRGISTIEFCAAADNPGVDADEGVGWDMVAVNFEGFVGDAEEELRDGLCEAESFLEDGLEVGEGETFFVCGGWPRHLSGCVGGVDFVLKEGVDSGVVADESE